ncbi:hypothetical protein AZ54_01750 [Xanthomonas oryzae pv. oryzae PXO86]|nr:hypothetical protein AZ54_01750 [Xanthomonas oryzae pv. oryzae PXO86]
MLLGKRLPRSIASVIARQLAVEEKSFHLDASAHLVVITAADG